MLPVMDDFARRGWGTVAVDFRGHGGSDGPPQTTLGWREADDVRAVVDGLVDPPQVLYGFSMGAVAILRACAELDVRADALVLEAPFDTLHQTVRNRFVQMGLPASPGAELLLFWGSVSMGIPGHRHDAVDYASRCPTPALVLGGVDDPNARTDEVERVARALPQGTFVETAGAHELAVVADPQAWSRALDGFLNR